MDEVKKEVWDTVHRHLESIFTRDVETYIATTDDDLSLFEWMVTPHRQDGLPFHIFMIENIWAGSISHQSHNESRVLVKGQEGWKVVHVHKSPSWDAPYQAPAG